MLEDNGFRASCADTVAYRKAFNYLIEDKGRYFGVKPEAINECVRAASPDERKLYSMSNDEITLFYTLIKTIKKGKL